MTKSLLQLIWWKVVIIRPFCWLRNKCVFCTCKQHSNRIPDFKVYVFLHIYCFIFYILIVFNATSSNELFQTFFFWKAIIGSTEILVFEMDQWFRIICFILRSMRLYVTVSDNNRAFCIVFGVSKSFLSRRLIFLIRFQLKISHKLFL